MTVQEWTKKRNPAKYIVKGAVNGLEKRLKDPAITGKEAVAIRDALEPLRMVMMEWDEQTAVSKMNCCGK